VLSIGTAGGANSTDHVGTIQIVSSATLYQQASPPGSWPTYSNTWSAPTTTLSKQQFSGLLVPIPTTGPLLAQLWDQFNQHYDVKETLAELDPDHLNRGDPVPAVHIHSAYAMSLLTSATFLVGTTDNRYAAYACIEMDDAIVARVCQEANVPFGSVRNISDPAQNPELPTAVQANWGGAVYDSYGFYTSFNGALVAWATLS
jgi:nucleoside phosphorylase